MSEKKKVVVIGGGTGSFTVLSGLKNYDNLDLTAVVSMADDGGSTGILRDEYGVLPPGDIRQCLVALSDADELMRKLFSFRFSEGVLRGHNFGNIFISTIEKMTGNFNEALVAINNILKVRGRVLPITLDNVRLVAEFNNRKKIFGQNKIAAANFEILSGVKRVYFDKAARVNSLALAAIKNANLIIVGPGHFYTSIIPNFLIKGIRSAVVNSHATKVFVCNLMNQFGQTDNFTPVDFVNKIEELIVPNVFDFVLYNTKLPPKFLLEKYGEEGEPVLFDSVSHERYNRFVGKNLFSGVMASKQVRGDLLRRTLVRHDSRLLAKAIMDLI